MKDIVENKKILNSKNQLFLYGYKDYFNFFSNLLESGKLPNSIILSGPKGLGKSTFAYHIINFFLSKKESKSYSLKEFSINENNSSYQKLTSSVHPNFFLLENKLSEKDIKIDQTRDLLKFLAKTNYGSNFKIVLIDNAELLNINSSNSLLKAIEEPHNNTFFIIIHDSSSKILSTIKSRCCEFKFFINFSEKRKIFKKLLNQYNINFPLIDFEENLFFESPGNMIKHIFAFNSEGNFVLKDKLSAIDYLIKNYKKDNQNYTISSLTFYIQLFYKNLILNNQINLNNLTYNYNKILKTLHNFKKFNLDEKNVFFTIKSILLNETR